MFEDLLNASLVFIFLVILGFLVSDIFRMGRYLGVPSISKTDTERLLDYVSIAIFFLTIFFILIIMILDPQKPNFISDSVSPFFTVILNYLDKHFISQTIVLAYLGLFFWISVIFIFVYIAVFFVGFSIKFFDENYIEVIFTDDSKKRFRSILSETDDFIFFEGIDKLFRWEAIHQEKIQSMKSVRDKSYVDLILVSNVPILIDLGKKILQKGKNTISRICTGRKNKNENHDLKK